MTNEPYLVTTDQDKDAITALHSICFGDMDWSYLQAALDDENYFAILVGCDEDEQPAGYLVCHVRGKESDGKWMGVRPEKRREGLAIKVAFAGMKECRNRGAEYFNAYPCESNTHVNELGNLFHPKLGMVLMDSFSDYNIRDGVRGEFITQHWRASLLTVPNKLCNTISYHCIT